MHVALNGYFWGQPHTGSGQYLRHLWDALLQLPPNTSPDATSSGFDTYVLLPPPPPLPDSKPARRALPQTLRGIRSRNLDKLLWEQWGVIREARRCRAQLLHAPYLSGPLIKPCPVVVTAHDMIPWVVPGYKGSAAVQLYLRLTAAGAKRADFIIADSNASRRDVIRVLRVPPRRVRTVYLGVQPQPEYTAEQLDEVRRKFGLPTNFAFYIGGFDRRKNVPLLLRAWRAALSALAPEWCESDKPVLAIGGAVPEPGGLFPDVRGEVATLNLLGTDAPVRYLGRISESDKFMLMAAARLFIYPSLYEGFGLDPLEAMSVGCPVVSSSGGSLSEVVADAGLLVPPNDEEALCRATVRAWTDDALRTDFSERGKNRAGRFTWDRTAELTRSIYRVVLEKTKDEARRTKYR